MQPGESVLPCLSAFGNVPYNDVVLLVSACNGIPFRGPEQDEGRKQKRDPLVPLDERVPCHKAVEDERGSLEWIGYAVAEGDDEVEVSGIEDPALEAPVLTPLARMISIW